MKIILVFIAFLFATIFASPYFVEGLNMRWWIGGGAVLWTTIFAVRFTTSSPVAWIDGLIVIVYCIAIISDTNTFAQKSAYVLNIVLAIEIFCIMLVRILRMHSSIEQQAIRG